MIVCSDCKTDEFKEIGIQQHGKVMFAHLTFTCNKCGKQYNDSSPYVDNKSMQNIRRRLMKKFQVEGKQSIDFILRLKIEDMITAIKEEVAAQAVRL
ncbi:MAG: hypothetical protein HQK91_07265 [Nitrospirae bacterium]|nr:hypothetical protein [Nitrospirota bacterium]MBF0541233.1 hypothetical protein [Nitrospirota bacterium]